MDMKKIIEYFPENKSFTKQQFHNVVQKVNEQYAESSLSWLLSELKKERKIANVGNVSNE